MKDHNVSERQLREIGENDCLRFLSAVSRVSRSCAGPTQISNGPAVLMQIDVHTKAGEKTTWVTDANGWKVLDGDTWLNPDVRAKVCFGPGCGAGGGTGRVEHTDARHEPIGWRTNPTFDDADWGSAVQISTPSLLKSELIPRMAGAAVEVTDDVKPVRTTANPASTQPIYHYL